MSHRSWPAWLALTAGVAVASYAIVAQEPPAAQPADAPADLFSAGRAMKHVEAIAIEPHPTGSGANIKVREYLVARLAELGFESEIQTPRDPSRPERNVLARLKGRGAAGKKSLLLCAHYDSVETSPGAADNASGVAVVLETLRALKATAPLDRDVIALFDDGEERGLVGASIFLEEHPWAMEVGVALNVDAGGNGGPSILFETSEENGWLVRQFAEASPHPMAMSLSMDVYRIMPNYSDFTLFKRAGIGGLNFVFGRSRASYHTEEDRPGNLDPRSVQHQGENVLAMARHLGRMELEDVRRENEVYFSVLNRTVLSYPFAWAMPAALGSAGLFLLTLILGLLMGRVKVTDLLVGLVAGPVAGLAAIFTAGAFWLVLKDQFETLGVPAFRINMPILSACALVAATAMLALIRVLARGRSLEATSLGSLAWLVALAIASARFLPGSSYVFAWPTIAMLLALGLSMTMRRGSGWGKEALFLGSLPALLILPPLAREAFEGLSLRLATPSMSLVVLSVEMLLPLLWPIVATPRPD